MKLVRRNQLVILVITLMFITVGYLSYENNSVDNKAIATSINDLTFGDAALVSSNELELNEEVGIIENSVSVIEEAEISSVSTNNNLINLEDYFVSSKLQRDAMYSQMIEAYQRILDNKDISQEQKTISSEQINKINSTRNAIMICENLIKNKDIQDVVIFVNDESVNVIIKSEANTQELIAQIQNIISRELNVQIDNIHISSK